MERDFMGLNSSDTRASVKREITDEGPETQWSLNGSSHPHLISYMSGDSQDDGMKEMVPDPITSSAFDHVPTTSVGEFQTSPLLVGKPLLTTNFTSYGENYGSSTPITRQQFLGTPMMMSSPIGLTNPGNDYKPLACPAQMTIFYGGKVGVYDEISPEKFQAIMLLAGNGSSLASSTTLERPQLSPPINKNEISFSSHPSLKSNKDDNVVIKTTEFSSLEVMTKTTGVSPSPVCRPEPRRVISSKGPIPVSFLTPSAVPQIRKASLTRFLEKRKERVRSAGPYKKPQEGFTQENNDQA